MKYLIVFISIAMALSCNNNSKTEETDPSLIPPPSGIAAPANIGFNIISEYPHDTSAYTQGLEFYNGKLYESTGDYTNSSIRITDYKTGKVLQKHSMGSDKIFGEGITFLNGKLYQLTWESNIVYVYDAANINKPIKTFNWPYDGWGITNNGKDLILSDGSANLYFVNPEDFKVLNTISVQTDKGPIENINELEYVNGMIYANVYTTSSIIKIDSESGHVKGILNFPDFGTKERQTNPRADYFNGIAYDSSSKNLFVTGKRWSKLYEVKLD
ncbi:MAG TPA: glutaminyl-peptide cyclotransferase [Ferruginibacter sp.]|nr:glutaminyl-peptide cyclotransferase [Ferruginibacter sp.]HRE62212.1 glutaminyl-peptide cyclotransferase [Ferruginibacter sp.]